MVTHPTERFLNGREVQAVLPEGQHFYEFGVRACDSATILLTSGQDVSVLLQLQITNTFTILFKGEDELARAMTPGAVFGTKSPDKS